MPTYVATALGVIVALIATIVICILITPKSKEGQYTGFLKFIRDYFLMKYLVIEAILRFFFILFTIACFTCGFFLLFARTPGYFYYEGSSTAIYGLLLIIFGPITVRICYEVSMLTIMTLKNIIEINAKMPGDAKNATSAFDIPLPNMPKNNQSFDTNTNQTLNFGVIQDLFSDANQNYDAMPPAPPLEEQIGTPIVPSDSKICPNCGQLIHVDAQYCTVCGSKLQ